jgi:hypothetical protein
MNIACILHFAIHALKQKKNIDYSRNLINGTFHSQSTKRAMQARVNWDRLGTPLLYKKNVCKQVGIAICWLKSGICSIT